MTPLDRLDSILFTDAESYPRDWFDRLAVVGSWIILAGLVWIGVVLR